MKKLSGKSTPDQLAALRSKLDKNDTRTINDALFMLKELNERRRQICATCRYYDRCCVHPRGLLGAHSVDYCSLWADGRSRNERWAPHQKKEG